MSAAASKSKMQIPDQKKRFALLVDGYVKDLFTTGMVLQRLEYDVYIVNTAEDALTIMNAAKPVLVITELALPRASGLELLVRIKQDPKTKTIPVIIHTAAVDPAKERHCLASGCSAFLKKPVEPDVLFRAIQEATEITPRLHFRLKTLLPVMVGGQTMAGGVLPTEYVTEISESGVFVRTLNPRPLNGIFPVTIIIHSMPVKLRAVVLRSSGLNTGFFSEPGMGMKFVEISDTDRELVRNYIKGQLMKDIYTPQ
jgi:CheY-like chemotaxis protein